MKYPLLLLVFILATKALLALLIILSGVIGLGPDEAQYWTWSQSLDFGYYSKPPAIAWQIWLGTWFFGNTELGVRFIAAFNSFLLPIAVYFLSRASALTESSSFWAALSIGLSPLGLISSFLATTDGGLVLFWTLSCIVIAKGLTKKEAPNYFLLGFFILCGALFKWPIYFLWLLVLLTILAAPSFRSTKFFAGFALSLLGLIPSLYWNASHEFATFRHVFTTMMGGHGKEAGVSPFFKGNLMEFLGAQAALFSPVLFGLLLLTFIPLFINRKRAPSALLFCGSSVFILLIVYSALSAFQKMQGNWCIFIYPMAAPLVSWFCFERVSWGKIWLKGGIVVSCLLSGLVLSIPFVQTYSIAYLPYKINPFRHNVGWGRLGESIIQAGYDPKQDFIFADKYQMASIASFYSPGQKRAYFFNLRGARKNQFSYWPGIEVENLRKTGYFLIAENEPHLTKLIKNEIDGYQKDLESYFENVEYLGAFPLFYNNNKAVKGVIIFKCSDYNGKIPETSELF